MRGAAPRHPKSLSAWLHAQHEGLAAEKELRDRHPAEWAKGRALGLHLDQIKADIERYGHIAAWR